MISWKLEQWCVQAVHQIRYRPDRMAVYQELRQHLDDRCDAFLAQGMTNDQAIEKTLDAMGDPTELAPQLAAIHLPFWGYVYSILKGIVIALLIICLIPFGRFCAYAFDTYANPDRAWDYTAENNPSLISHTTPNVSSVCDGYTFTVKRAALFRQTDDGLLRYYRLQLRIRHPHLWSSPPDIVDYLWVRDNLGNVYPCFADSIHTRRYISGECRITGPHSSVYHMNLYSIPSECQWIELCYDREGRNLVLRLELTGGEQT